MLRTELLVKDSEFAESNQDNRSGTADSKHNIVPETLSTVYRLSLLPHSLTATKTTLFHRFFSPM